MKLSLRVRRPSIFECGQLVTRVRYRAPCNSAFFIAWSAYPGRLRIDSARLETAWYNSSMSVDEAFLRHLLSGIVLQPEQIRFDSS
jgi:hypothetical protein